MTTPKKPVDPTVSKAIRRWKEFCDKHPGLSEPAAHGVLVDDDLVVLHRDAGPGGIVAVYRIEAPGKLKLLAW
jgi:hypothetical protein